MSCSSSQLSVVLSTSTLSEHNHSKMGQQNMLIMSCPSTSLPYSRSQDSPWHSGARLLLHWFMSGINAQQLLWAMLHPMNYGMGTNQMYPTFECRNQQHMCISKRTSTAHCAYIMRSACSLGIQMAARGGSSTTQPQSAQSSLNVLILMSTLLLLCPHPLHQMSKLLHLCYNSLLSTILGLLFLFTDDTLVLLIVQYYHTITHSLSS